MKPIRRTLLIIFGGIAGALVVAGGIVFAVQRLRPGNAQPLPAAYREATIARGDLRETASATGPVKARQRSDMSFLLPGSVGQINAAEGQHVRAGDTLMSLDVSKFQFDLTDAQLTLESQQIAFNQLVQGPDKYDVAAARAAVGRAAAQLAQLTEPPSEDTIRLAQQNLETQRDNLYSAQARRDQIVAVMNLPRKLSKASAGQFADQDYYQALEDISSAELGVKIAEQQLLDAQQGTSSNDIAVARASLAQSQATLNRLLEGPTPDDLELANVQIQQAQVAVQAARSALTNAVLIAPFDGVIGKLNYLPGEQALPGQTALVVLDDSAYHVDVLIDEVDIARIKEGQVAFIKLDAYPDQQLSGHVIKIAPDATTLNGVVSYLVRVDLDKTGLALRDGMTATVDIVVSQLTNVLLVPNWAVRFDRTTGNAFVNIRRPDNTIEEIQIQVGQRGENYSEVRAGLKQGDVVVVSLDRQQLAGPGSQGSSQ